MKLLLLIILSITISFSDTSLTWQDNYSTQSVKKDWQGALDFCKNLDFSGHKDWRLATIKELETTQEKFKNIGASGYYWSSTAHDSNKEFAWIMNFKRGYKYKNYKTYERYIRCVREK